MGHQKIRKEQKEKDDQKNKFEIFWCEEEYRSYRLISQSEENKLARLETQPEMASHIQGPKPSSLLLN